MQKRQILEQESKTLNLHYEMEKAEAKIKAYETFEENSQHSIKKFSEPADKSQFVRDYLHKIEYNPSDVKSQTIRRDTEQNERKLQVILNEDEASAVSKSDVRKQQSDLNQVLRYLQAPEVDIDIFSGKSIDYQYFISTFVEVVETKIEEPKGRLTRLLKYLEGEAKDLVRGCIHLYKEARKLLDKYYGDPYRIISEYRKELRVWPKIKSHGPTAFRKFYSFLLKQVWQVPNSVSHITTQN